MSEKIRLTQYSHGAGCGCKLSPAVLDRILAGREAAPHGERLLVGNSSRDDAAAYDLGDGQVILSTTDFFMPIVDDPFDFGRIASANAISDVYAMGGRPLMAIAILGWPIDKLSPEVAGLVLDGARAICAEAGCALAGGHSIDSPEPIFGLAVTGQVPRAQLKRNDTGKAGDLLFLTKPVGVGILTTAEKRSKLKPEHEGLAAASMTRLNSVGALLSKLEGVHAMTDVTGFGLLGHLSELATGSGLRAIVSLEDVPRLADLDAYLDAGCIPGGTGRNWESYGHKVGQISDRARALLCDPQTSGGLLISVAPEALDAVREVLVSSDLGAFTKPLGRLEALTSPGQGPWVIVQE